jgi:hypothetical protein
MNSDGDWKDWLTNFPKPRSRREHPYDYARRLQSYLSGHPPVTKLREPERTASIRLLNRRRADLAGLEYKAARSRFITGVGGAFLTAASVPFSLLLPAVGLASLLYGLNEIRAAQVASDTTNVVDQLGLLVDRLVDEIEGEP